VGLGTTVALIAWFGGWGALALWRHWKCPPPPLLCPGAGENYLRAEALTWGPWRWVFRAGDLAVIAVALWVIVRLCRAGQD
jgi:hypothetical protein